jgi:hypothetical protein
MNQFQCIRSQVLSNIELAKAVVQLAERYAKSDFNNYREDNSGCYFLSRFLPSLDPFAEVLLIDFASLKGTPISSETSMHLAREWGGMSQQRCGVSWRLKRVSFGDQADGEIFISAGLGRHGFYCGVYASLDKSPGYRDRKVRADFFEDILTAMGLRDQIHLQWEDDDFLMESPQHWKLNFPVAELRGRNPRAFEVIGFSDIGQALEIGKMLSEKLAGVKPSSAFFGAFRKSEYEQVWSHLKGQAGPWMGLIYGSLREESKEALAGKFSATALQGPIPAFDWHTADTEEQVFGAITIEESSGYLEISVEHRAECDLFAQTAFLSDVAFEEV